MCLLHCLHFLSVFFIVSQIFGDIRSSSLSLPEPVTKSVGEQNRSIKLSLSKVKNRSINRRWAKSVDKNRRWANSVDKNSRWENSVDKNCEGVQSASIESSFYFLPRICAIFIRNYVATLTQTRMARFVQYASNTLTWLVSNPVPCLLCMVQRTKRDHASVVSKESALIVDVSRSEFVSITWSAPKRLQALLQAMCMWLPLAS